MASSSWHASRLTISLNTSQVGERRTTGLSRRGSPDPEHCSVTAVADRPRRGQSEALPEWVVTPAKLTADTFHRVPAGLGPQERTEASQPGRAQWAQRKRRMGAAWGHQFRPRKAS